MNRSSIFRKGLRTLFQAVGRVLLFFLARVRITGRENFPARGPLILAGNHVGLMEVVMMAVYPPYPMEFLGSGDIPLDPQFSWIAKLWGFIPVRRGNLDREAIRRSVDVLQQGGVIAVFPEGGIWSPENMPARLGIALISAQADAPVLPIGFGGVQRAYQAILKLRRPQLIMNVGKPMPAVVLERPGYSRKEALAESAKEILHQIQALLPAWQTRLADKADESYDLEIKLVPDNPESEQPAALMPEKLRPPVAKLLLHPVIMDIFNRNLNLPVEALNRLKNVHNPQLIAVSLQSVIEYLDTNPGFLTYRFGMAEGIAMKDSLIALHGLAVSASHEGLQLFVRPVHTWVDPESGEQVVQDEVKKPDLY